jgi:hypothetical protein
MKKSMYATVAVAILFAVASCEKNEDPVYPTHSVTVQLLYPDRFEPHNGVEVSLGDYRSQTDAAGIATFAVTAGNYTASAFEQREDEFGKFSLNASTNITITEGWADTDTVKLSYTVSESSNKIIIKELYFGGCPKDDGNGSFNYGAYLILYNNSDDPANLKYLTVATTIPSNGNATNNFLSSGVLSYEAEKWLPAGFGVFYFPGDVTLAPGEQLVVALNSAINNTITYSQSINFARPEYYAVYDPESGYDHPLNYPAPAQEIPVSHYLKAIRLTGVTSNAYILSVNSPALFIFTPPAGSSPVEVANDASRLTTHGASASQAVLKVPVDWVVDAVEVFNNPNLATSAKRLTLNVDGGWVGHNNTLGRSVYRNVNKVATEAIPENAGKLVYSYSLGTADLENGSTDPSGIDAEASIKNGARIIYSETNNSTNDFHQRIKASLRN